MDKKEAHYELVSKLSFKTIELVPCILNTYDIYTIIKNNSAKMKQLLIFSLLLIGANAANAQQKYYPFIINKKAGITDRSGIEIIKPIYKYASEIPAKNQVYLQNFSDVPDVVFNTTTGAKQSYESAVDNRIKIGKVPYSDMYNQGKRFLLSERNEHTIPLANRFSELFQAGKYILEKYKVTQFPKPKNAPPKKYKNGKLIPPPPVMAEMPIEVDYFAVRTNDESFKVVLKGNFISYKLFYKTKNEKTDGAESIVTLKTYNQNVEDNFDYLVFTNKKMNFIYDDQLNLVKSFVLADSDEAKLMEETEKIVKSGLSDYGDNNGPPPPMMAPNGNVKVSSKAEVKYPFFYLEELPNGNTLFAQQETEEISHHVFEIATDNRVRLDKEDFVIQFGDNQFNFDPKTGKIFLPKNYIDLLGIKII